uniref:tumor necrosis factor receptor superfamily member 5-like n=1 Tax=Semicossyphus pulcher TaxID=241346 RepID=UPI0037E707A7
MITPLTHFYSPVQSCTQRVPGHIFVTFSTTMPTLRYLPLPLLCSLSLLSAVLSLQCNSSQYIWPRGHDTLCCDMCPAGNRLFWRSSINCDKECVPCTTGQFADTSTVELSCSFCQKCNQQKMEYKSQCASTHDAVCGCEAGYRCKDEHCSECVKIQTATTPTSPTTLPPSTTDPKPAFPTTVRASPKPSTDTVWLPVVILVLSAVVICVGASLHWVRTKLGYYLIKKPASVVTYSEDEEVSKPIQEVCGKCDQLLDV